jgi:hypothetical protein
MSCEQKTQVCPSAQPEQTDRSTSTAATPPVQPSSSVVCKYINRSGGCRNGDTCKFSHVRYCRYFNNPRGCFKGDECQYVHQERKISNCVECGTESSKQRCYSCYVKFVGGDVSVAPQVSQRFSRTHDTGVSARDTRNGTGGQPRGRGGFVGRGRGRGRGGGGGGETSQWRQAS